MRLIKFLLLTTFISLSVQLYSMPPHPDLIDQYRKEGQLKSLMNRVEAINTKMNMNSPAKVFPADGVRKVPVLLVNFAEPYQASSDFFSYSGNIRNMDMPLYGLFLVFLTALIIMIRRHGYAVGFIPRFSVPVSLLLFVFAISCGVDNKKDSDDFPTSPDVYSSLLNGNAVSDLSVKKYYQDMSNNQLNLTFDVYGPVKVSRSWDYYGENYAGNDMHSGELASEALRLMVSKYPTVDFAAYDNDGSGDVDAVIIIHEGPGEETVGGADAVWSHQWDLKSAGVSGDGYGPVNASGGVLFNVYTMQPEYTNTRGDSSIGVFAHEFGHVLGLPDLYDTSHVTYGVGNWSLMAGGSWKGPVSNDGTTPAPLLAWERFKIGGAGWVVITTLVSADNQEIKNIEVSKEVFKVVLDDATSGQEQYLMIEGKESSTPSLWYVPGSGILVSHIHQGVITKYTVSDAVNAGSSRVHGINIIEADMAADLWQDSPAGNGGTASDLYTPSGSLAAVKYNDNVTYLKSSVSGTIVTINDMIQTGTSPWSMSFDVVP